MIKSITCLFFILLLPAIAANCQTGNIPLGTWRFHNAKNNSQTIASANYKIYCGTPGGIFYIDKNDFSINSLSKLNGLSDQYSTFIRYSEATKSLIIAYQTGNIDVIKDNKIYNLPDILNASLVGSKKINHINFYKNDAVLACDFGVVIINLDKMEVKESWLAIGPGGNTVKAYSSALLGDTIFLGTSIGILKALWANSNLMDYKNWKKIIIADSLSSKEIKRLIVYENNLFAAIDGLGLHKMKNNTWTNIYADKRNYTMLNAGKAGLLFSFPDALMSFSGNNFMEIKGDQLYAINDAVYDSEEKIWFAAGGGIVSYDVENRNTSKYAPNGPVVNDIFALEFPLDGKIYALAGGYDGSLSAQSRLGAYSAFETWGWNNKYAGYDNLPNFNDLVSITYDESRNRYIYGSNGYGTIVWDVSENNYTIIDGSTTSCPLVNALAVGSTEKYFKIPNVYYDKTTANTWICNVNGTTGNTSSIFKLKEGVNCDGYYFPLFEARFPMQILADDGDNKWVRIRSAIAGGGILVFNESTLIGNTPKYKLLKEGIGNGNLSNNGVNCMVKDRNGDIWLGTNKGVCVFYSPSFILSDNINLDAATPIFENHPLFFDQAVTAMDVDGGNRKWIGTGNGLYLFSPDGTRVIHYYNASNSPLISNNITSIKINQVTGEVFINTDKGLVSFREAATAGTDSPGSISIFPNPVKTNFSGLIGFAGLATDAIVKVTDISGRLVYETKSNGGGASWNGRDYNGKKLEPGVYVVLTAKDDGSSSIAGKLFVVD